MGILVNVTRKLQAVPCKADPCGSGWLKRHLSAIAAPRGSEQALVNMLRGWLEYAERHAAYYGTPVGDDGVLGPYWADIGQGIRRLLDGPVGRLDCGTIESIITGEMRAEGFDPDNL